MSRGPDIGTALTRAIEKQARQSRCTAEVTDAEWQRWASATFAGARHRLTLAAMPCPALETWLAALPEAEIEVRGHLVADVAVVAVRRSAAAVAIELEVLTVEDR